MNKALNFRNWTSGGNCYVMNAASENEWVDFQETVIEELKTRFGDDFFIVIWTNRSRDNDFFNVPFAKLKHVFTAEHITTGKVNRRWPAIVRNMKFLVRGSSQLAIDIMEDYGNLHQGDDHSKTRGYLRLVAAPRVYK